MRAARIASRLRSHLERQSCDRGLELPQLPLLTRSRTAPAVAMAALWPPAVQRRPAPLAETALRKRSCGFRSSPGRCHGFNYSPPSNKRG